MKTKEVYCLAELQSISEAIPPSSEAVPLIGLYYISSIGIVCCATAFNVITLKVRKIAASRGEQSVRDANFRSIDLAPPVKAARCRHGSRSLCSATLQRCDKTANKSIGDFKRFQLLMITINEPDSITLLKTSQASERAEGC